MRNILTNITKVRPNAPNVYADDSSDDIDLLSVSVHPLIKKMYLQMSQRVFQAPQTCTTVILGIESLAVQS